MGRIVIVGAGIIGLWTSLLLTEQGLGHDITHVAKHLPGDLSIEYTSPIAGANFSCTFGGSDPKTLRLCRISYPLLKRIFKKFDSQKTEAGFEKLPQNEYFEEVPDDQTIQIYRDYLDDFEVITDQADLKARGAAFGLRYTSLNIYSPKMLVFLRKYLESQGVRFVRASLNHIKDAPQVAGVVSPSVVFNCTGVLATKLGGIKDPNENFPIRGQVLIVRAPWIKSNYGIARSGHPPTYIIPRPHSNGRVILGGYYDKGDWTEGTNGDQSKSILARTTKLLPELLKEGPLEILDERSGLRPGREGGPRTEREVIDGLLVIHNYGIGGIGYQCGLGVSQDAVNLFLNSNAEH